MNKSRLLVMCSIVLAMLISSIDTTILNTTMPIISQELLGFDLYAWAFASYMIASTILAPIAGRLSDLFGRKKLFALGIMIFFIGSLLCGISNNMIQLILFRAIQGMGAGFMIPFPAIIAGDLFPMEKRGKIQALFTAMWALSAVIAPVLGSFFVEVLTWRWIFYINVPVCIIALLTLIPYKEEYKPKRASVDYIGAALFGVGITFTLLITVAESNTLLYAAIGILFIILFFFFEKKHPSPIVPFTIFKNRTISWMFINAFIGNLALFGTSSYIPLFLQEVADLSVIWSGVSLLGMAIGWMAMSVPAGKWIIKYGYRILLIIGNTFLLLSGLLLVSLNETHGFWYIFFAMIIQGLAFGLLSTVGVLGAQALVGTHEKGSSTSFLMFCRNMGTVIGVTIMGSLLARGATYMDGIHYLFLFGFITSILAFISAFFIHNEDVIQKKAKAS